MSRKQRQTREFFPPGARVPPQALTMGIATILEAKSILLLVTGRSKVDAMRGTLERQIAPDCPASALRLHPACTMLCDEAAAGGLSGTTRSRFFMEGG